jgi:hypothetical protein
VNVQTASLAEEMLSEAVPSPRPPPPSPRESASSRGAGLLAGASSSSWADEARRLAAATSLAAVFGAAVGLRHGGLALVSGAVGAPLGILAVTGLAVPALVIMLSLANAPVEAKDLARATSRAATKAGLFLAGVSPAAALFVVTVEDAITVSIVGFGALLLSGVIAAGSFWGDMKPLLASAPPPTRRLMRIALVGFIVFAAVLATRVWWMAFPGLTEVS